MLARPPRTAMEVYELLPETAHAEVIDNTLYMPPCPSFEHQDVSADLLTDIRVHTRKTKSGKCVDAPVALHLSDDEVVEPDLVFIRTERLDIVQDGKIKGVPDFIIELLSPSNRSHDLKRKFNLYQQFGVPEYIIIDPLTKDVIHYVLQEGVYLQQPSQKGTFHSQVLGATFSF